jgi:hypothetical protein
MKSENSFSLTIAAIGAALLAQSLLAQQGAAPTFASPTDAVERLLQTVQSNDTAAIEKVLGGPTDLASSRDHDQDKLDREMFVTKYQEMHRLQREPDGSVALYIGAENWAFPIPLVQQGGVWRFDAEAGGKEVLFRRIGENELKAIETCHDILAGHKPGSGADTNSAGVLIDGYYFRVLASPTKNTAVAVAYPAEYRLSGVMTFVVTGNNVIYEKDLGAGTSAVGSTLTSFRKDGTWHRVPD